MSHPIRIAHRGASGKGLAPENTLAAFRKALQIGTDAIEMDVHLSKDGHVVVCHDDTLGRTTDLRGAIKDLTLSQIKQADAGSRFDPSFAGERVPTLKETLDLIRDRALALVEIKPEDITREVVRVIEADDAAGRVVVQSFHEQVVQDVGALNPCIRRALLVSLGAVDIRLTRAARLVERTTQVGADILALSQSAATPELVCELHRQHLALYVWTVDEPDLMNSMIRIGVDGIISNYPDRLKLCTDRLPKT
ncbi:MAG: glycerophosphodiester phosphodiesterase family protein [Candidatus Latescibacterota bacterium]